MQHYLAAKFDLYSDTKLINMVITNIVRDNDNKNSGEVYVSDPIGSKGDYTENI